MTASLLDGKLVANNLKNNIKQQVENRVALGLRSPALAVILMGDDPASHIYVSNKRQACREVGITSHYYNLSVQTSQIELINLIITLNQSDAIDGILVQLPLPSHINTEQVIETIDPKKDVDGFHPYNIGRLTQQLPLLRPCTPLGIMQLLKAYNLPVKAKHAVIVGASNIVGRPMALEFLLAGTTVTVCHRLTTSLQNHVQMADILVVATGIQDLIEPQWLNSNQIIIDVGIHRLPNGKIRGDMNFDEVFERVAWLTPVPGGVGPMTIISLLQNTLLAQKVDD